MTTISIDTRLPSFLLKPFETEAKYSVIKAGRRTGKTMSATRWMIAELLEETRNGLWVDTVQTNLSNYVDRYFRPLLKDIWHLCRWNGQKYTLHFPNGSYIDFRSAERPENMEGFEYSRSILNEAGIILRSQELWNNTLQPMFKGAKTKVRIIGTPKGRNKFAELYARGQDSTNNEWESYSFSAYQSPFWTQRELDRIKSEVPDEVWRQEYLAEILEGSGSVFRQIYKCFGSKKLDVPEEGRRYVMSVDLAKHTDFTVIYVADAESKEIVYQDRFNKIDWGFQKQRIINTYRTWECDAMILDATGVGDPIYDDLLNAGLNVEPFKFTSESKKLLVQSLSVAIDNVTIFFYPFPELTSELEIFGYDISASGNIRYNAPDGFHDDCVMSLALINKLLSTYVGRMDQAVYY